MFHACSSVLHPFKVRQQKPHIAFYPVIHPAQYCPRLGTSTKRTQCHSHGHGKVSAHHSTTPVHSLLSSFVDSHLWQMAEEFGDSQGADFIQVTTTYVINSRHELLDQYMAAGENANVLVGSHSAMLMLHHLTAARALGKPLVFLTHDLTLPTAEYSFNPVESRVQDYGRLQNMLNHCMFSLTFGAAITFGRNREWRQLCRELNLTTPWLFMELFSPQFLADFSVIYTADPTLWPRPADLFPHWLSTGYFCHS